ncbi:peptidase M28 family protein [Gordonia rhizosphera NBRC 16068]|uniref:Peptidase M28 family protein n=1 Tax=Gordonia rhizosphera NBRC 16068 TaxID=1108045 RepID=K6WU69_9ACTN|nr:peptidase M28 family protein [Gordonia rhizosphera NBRC 16068]
MEPLTPDDLAHAVTVDNVMAHIRALQQVADADGGNRAAGTSGYDASLAYVADRLRAAGYLVSTPQFEFPRFDSGPVQLGADGGRVDSQVLRYSAGTGGETLTATPVEISGHGCADSDYPSAVSDSIAVITRGTCTFADKAHRAQEAGAVAVIVVNNTAGPLNGATLGVDDRPSIPVVGIARDSGATVGGASSVSLSVTASTTPIVSHSVIAQTRTGDTDDVVVAGAHLDGVRAGPGINDNATGTAALLETALRLGSTPRAAHAVRFAFWGAEEDGLVGSRSYVDSLDPAERDAVALYLNFDMLASPNGGYFTYDGDGSARLGGRAGPPGSAGIEHLFTAFFASRGVPVQPAAFDGRSDHAPFAEIGVPVGGLTTGSDREKSAAEADLWGGHTGTAFDPNYHGPDDNVANVNTGLLAVNASAIGFAIATYALSTDGPDGVPTKEDRHRSDG